MNHEPLIGQLLIQDQLQQVLKSFDMLGEASLEHPPHLRDHVGAEHKDKVAAERVLKDFVGEPGPK